MINLYIFLQKKFIKYIPKIGVAGGGGGMFSPVVEPPMSVSELRTSLSSLSIIIETVKSKALLVPFSF